MDELIDYVINFFSNLMIIFIAWGLGNLTVNRYQKRKDIKGTASNFIQELNSWSSDLINLNLKVLDLEYRRGIKEFDDLSLRFKNESTNLILKANSLMQRIRFEFNSQEKLNSLVSLLDDLIKDYFFNLNKVREAESINDIAVPFFSTLEALKLVRKNISQIIDTFHGLYG